MYSCGLNDASGEWGFDVGLPCKSGVSGALLLVVPGVMGMALFSPPLDTSGNSRRGILCCEAMAARFSLSIFDGLLPDSKRPKMDPRNKTSASRGKDAFAVSSAPRILLHAVHSGDNEAVRSLLETGVVDANVTDRYRRSALHIAASDGNLTVCMTLVAAGAIIDAVDIFGKTPVDNARDNRYDVVVGFLEESLLDAARRSGATEDDGDAGSKRPRSEVKKEEESSGV